MKKLSLRKRILFTGIMILLPSALSFAGLEIYVRSSRSLIDIYALTGRTKGTNPMADWAFLDAYSAFRPKPGEYSDGKTVNADGFISTPNIPLTKPSDTLRIVFLGGSSTAGTGRNLKNHETWPWKTVEMIRAKTDKKVDFINGAVGGYTSFESYGRLWSRLRYFSPDIIVVYHGWNEMYYFGHVEKMILWRTLPDGSWSFKRTGKPIKRYEPYAIDHIIKWSQALVRIRLRTDRFIRTRLGLPKHADGEVGPNKTSSLSSEFDSGGLEIWRTNLKFLKSASEIIGAKLFVAKQATLIVPDLPEAERNKCRYHYHGFDHNAHVQAFKGIYDVIEQEIPPESIIDASRISGQPKLFYDHVHPTAEGTTQIARIVSDFLVERTIKSEKQVMVQ